MTASDAVNVSADPGASVVTTPPPTPPEPESPPAAADPLDPPTLVAPADPLDPPALVAPASPPDPPALVAPADPLAPPTLVAPADPPAGWSLVLPPPLEHAAMASAAHVATVRIVILPVRSEPGARSATVRSILPQLTAFPSRRHSASCRCTGVLRAERLRSGSLPPRQQPCPSVASSCTRCL